MTLRNPAPQHHAHPVATILCVEDEIDLRTDIAEELAAAGYRVMEAGNGREALAALTIARPDLILCDITMPGLGGYEFMAQLRAERPDLAEVPFIFLTALADRSDMLQGKRAGADDYLVKPVDFDDLLATVGARLRFVDRVRTSLLAELEAEKRRLIDKALREGEGTLAALAAAFDRVAVGLFLIDEGGAVRLVNAAGRALAESCDGLVLSAAGLSAAAPDSARRLRRTVAELRQAGGGACLVPVEREEGRPLVLQLSVIAIPGGNARHVLVLAVDPDRQADVPPETLTVLFGCTATEARIAAALAGGKRPEEIGEAFGIKPTTVTFHLQNLFQKTRTHRQIDLMALLIRATAPLVL